MRELLDRLGLDTWLSERLVDPRDSARTAHAPDELICTLLLLQGQGWSDQTDVERLREDPIFRLVSARYEKGSILITTNKAIQDWPEVLAGDEVMATALLDRLLHRCHVINIKGRSYRLRDLEQRLAQGDHVPQPKPGR